MCVGDENRSEEPKIGLGVHEDKKWIIECKIKRLDLT